MNDYIPQNGEWNEAYYMLSTMSLEGNVNGIGLEKKTNGSIKQSQAAPRIGYGRWFQNFKGYMDYVAVFLCRLKNLWGNALQSIFEFWIFYLTHESRGQNLNECL